MRRLRLPDSTLPRPPEHPSSSGTRTSLAVSACSSPCAWLLVLVASLSAGCRRQAQGSDAGTADASAEADDALGTDNAGAAAPVPTSGPRLGALSLETNVLSKPERSSSRVGYLRLGAIVSREDRPVSTRGCAGGWYRVSPHGYVCVGDGATIDPDDPLVRAAAVRPDLSKPLPYKYAFVRAVAPLYLRIPTAEEQLRAEFKLKEHLDWWGRHSADANKITLGANDVLLNARGIAASSRGSDPSASASADAGPATRLGFRKSTELTGPELLGATSPDDPVPFWLQNGRSIPNISGFKVPPYAYFANRVRRHTGLALIGSFAAGPESFDRRFAVTTDLRLVPASKIKPDTASPFHGVGLGDGVDLPVAFVRAECNADKDNPKPCAHAYRLTDNEALADERTFSWRKFFALSGNTRRVGGALYRETKQGVWLKASDLGVVSAPTDWPAAAKAGRKWIDVSIENQTLTLWEGQKAVYVTLVSTGQDGLQDPKTTKSTPTGNFRIVSKHVTATMDSNERSSEGGGGGAVSEKAVGEGTREAAASSKAKTADNGERDDAETAQRRRGEGTFELRDVPYVQYFKGGYALHAAYWHDVFGKARSHGCINLAPIDARYLFQWSDPPLPAGWHGVESGSEFGDGTVVTIHK